jgi:hypothetical protein
MSLANKKPSILERIQIMTQVKTLLKPEGLYYTLSGDDLFTCCGEYQDRLYCVSHDNFQGCAFCSSFAYWEPCINDWQPCWDGE